MKRASLILGAVLGLLLAGEPSAECAGYVYFKDSPIVGEATHDGKGGWIEIQSLSWGTSPPAPPRGPAPAGVARKGPGRIVATKRTDKASTSLKQAAAKGTLLPSVEIDVAAQGPQPYLRYKLERCFVKSWSTSGDADAKGPFAGGTETFTLEFSGIAFHYGEQKPPGSLKAVPAVKQ